MVMGGALVDEGRRGRGGSRRGGARAEGDVGRGLEPELARACAAKAAGSMDVASKDGDVRVAGASREVEVEPADGVLEVAAREVEDDKEEVVEARRAW